MMPQTILQINYQFNGSPADHTILVMHVAEAIMATPGLVWKIWLMNETDHEAGGIYLFASRSNAAEYLHSPIIAGLVSNPTIYNVSTKLFEPHETLCKITRAPLSIISNPETYRLVS